MKSLLQFADIPRSMYYYWVNTFGMPDKYSELKDVIQAIYEEHQGRYGYEKQPWKPSVWIVVGVGILIALWMSRPRLTRKVRLKDKDVSIKLVVDNMFKRKGTTVIIPVNTLFQHRDVDEGAIQVQYRNRFFDNVSLFDRKLNDQLQNEPHQIVISNNNQMKKYSAGTVIRLETPRKRIKAAYLVATADLNEHRAVPDRHLKQTALAALWKHIAQRGYTDYREWPWSYKCIAI